MKARPTISLAALQHRRLDGQGRPVGLECRKCGCQHFNVVWTRQKGDGSIRRRRACRHCGHQITTVETTLAEAARREKEIEDDEQEDEE